MECEAGSCVSDTNSRRSRTESAGLTLGVALWMVPLMNGVRDFRPEWMKKETIFNTCCNTMTLLCR